MKSGRSLKRIIHACLDICTKGCGSEEEDYDGSETDISEVESLVEESPVGQTERQNKHCLRSAGSPAPASEG